MTKRFYQTDEEDESAVCDGSGEEWDTCINCDIEMPSSALDWAGLCEDCVPTSDGVS